NGARPYRGAGDRVGARRARRFHHVLAAAGAVQTSNRGISTHPLQAGGDGGEYRGGAPIDVLRRQRDRQQAQVRQGSLDGEVLRLGNGRAGDERRTATAWRLWVYARPANRAVLAGRA